MPREKKIIALPHEIFVSHAGDIVPGDFSGRSVFPIIMVHVAEKLTDNPRVFGGFFDVMKALMKKELKKAGYLAGIRS